MLSIFINFTGITHETNDYTAMVLNFMGLIVLVVCRFDIHRTIFATMTSIVRGLCRTSIVFFWVVLSPSLCPMDLISFIIFSNQTYFCQQKTYDEVFNKVIKFPLLLSMQKWVLNDTLLNMNMSYKKHDWYIILMLCI